MHSAIVLEFSENLSREWKYPSLNDKNECIEEGFKSRDHYSCQPDYMQCLLKNRLLDVKIKGRIIKYKLLSDILLKKSSAMRSYQLDIEIENQKHKVTLIDSCREIPLPKRVYPFFVAKRKVKTEWDNLDRTIFVDKYRVRNWEVLRWAIASKNNKLIEDLKNKKMLDVSDSLSPAEMTKLCSFYGKQLIDARVMDAAMIFPEEMDNPKSKLLRAPYYPWERRNSNTKLYDIQFRNAEILEKDIVDICKNSYAFECLHLAKSDSLVDSDSWMGMKEVMGGEFQFVKNNLNPSENILLSSEYFTLKSKAHRTGVRGAWSGEGKTRKEFEFFEFNGDLRKEGEFNVNFRCMRYR